MKKKIKKAQDIVLGISGKGVVDKRVKALEKAGFHVESLEYKWNFGKVGDIEEKEQGFWIQIKYATGGKSKNGYGVNSCYCAFINLEYSKLK